MSAKLWAGRFSMGTDKAVEAFTSSILVDKRLYAHDIQGSIAHAKMMAKQGIIEEDEAELMEKGLLEVKADIENGSFVYDDALEDIHMHIESALTEKIGDVARKLHTGRSRNDQVALDTRLYLRDETRVVIDGLKTLRGVIVALAEKQFGVVMPGYTHLQRAQPVLFSHHMMAYYEMFTRDQERFEDALTRINVMPLGAAALAGTTYPIDRHYVAELLDFPKVSANSMDTVADRDFIMEFLSAASIAMVHFSRFSEELILWSASEYHFIEISDAFTTGSSIMPQKKNPDIPELVRGKAGRVIGSLMAIITQVKGLPMAYNRDLQEDKPPLFDGVDTLKAVIDIYVRMLPNIKVMADVTRLSTETGFLNATDLADYLATKGMPFREAHSVAGKAVAFALGKGVELGDLSADEMKGFSELIEPDIFDFLTTDAMVERRTSFGGTAPSRVRKAMDQAIADLGGRIS
ncbi:argininosuccinate lyase [Desulfoluna butyratoxydans]|uniref:Argininosuccinate lyase n=1 Tax=Desulfoluna butyratoxydans TaxID=231438 RepID=A0A4U8YTV5_9BACT|nr:argininosuccinate lyase [Desulfoluna butyratoxydans]VFQ47314.1 argininosuccinate lyase [Desulfoluna butyratoxydans]